MVNFFDAPQPAELPLPSLGPAFATPPKQDSPAVTPAAAAPKMRRFGDVDEIRKWTFDNVMNAVTNLPPAQNQQFTLRITNPHYTGPEQFSLADEKQAILSGKDLVRPLKGTWELVDNATGNVVDTKSGILANVPYFTKRGTYIIGGNNYSLAHQMRLRSGVFTRQKDNGELEAHVNVLPGKGHSHRLYLDPETGIFRMQVGQARIPLVSALRVLGVTDRAINEHWGALAGSNLQKDDAAAFTKLYNHFVRRQDPNATHESKQQALAAALRGMELDTEVTTRTLGKPFKNVDADVLFATTKKLLQVSRGEVDADDRDALAFQQIVGPEDMLAERISRAGNLTRTMLWKATHNKNLKRMPSGLFTSALKDAIMNSGLGQPGEEVNPLQIFDQQGRVSRLGVGGIPSLDAVPEEARAVQPSHFGYIDPIVTPESAKVGVDGRFSRAVQKGDDGRLYAQFRDVKTGATGWRSAQDMADTVVAFSGELQRNEPYVRAMARGKLQMVPRESVEYELPHFEDAFSVTSNLVPMKSAMKGQRAAMAQRMLTQALPIVNAEAPLVQNAVPGVQDQSFEDVYSTQLGALRADRPGVVLDVQPGSITVQYAGGKKETIDLYDNFPFNRKTSITQSAAVRPGQQFTANQLLARSNYTDANGVSALGLNARVAYIPWKGENFDDAITVSESFAKRATSEHMYQHTLDRDDNLQLGKSRFIGSFPSKFKRAQLELLDDDGVIKPGTTVNPGDPLVLGVRKKDRTAYSLHQARNAFTDVSETWEHHAPGVVTDVVKTPKGVLVTVKSTMETQVGDKLSGRYGDKSVISRIVPDDEMPADSQGNKFEVLINPLGVISRSNPAQVVETVLGKIAAVTGKPYKVPDFSDISDLSAYAEQELRKHHMTDLEDIIDGNTGRKIPNILTGNRFIMKLHHTAESKGTGRGTGGYTAEGLPAKGGEGGSKRLSLMHVNALLSHGAIETLRDAHLHRGQSNAEHWRMVMSGYDPATPDSPGIYDKFLAVLKGAGINIRRNGAKMNIMALTDGDVDTLTNGRTIENAETVNWKDRLSPIKGGLFDTTLTGGPDGNRWAAIPLHEPMPNPVMEEPIRRLLGLTKDKFMGILAGTEKLNDETGPKAIGNALAAIDLDRELERTRAAVSGSKKTARDVAVRKLGYLKTAKRLGIHPKDWMLTKVPVLPPRFRPVSVMQGSKLPMVADANYLYKELIDANKQLATMKDLVADVGDERIAVYNAFKGVTGLGDPIHPKNQERQVKGLLRIAFGSAPKHSMVQRKLIGSAADLVGRAVIVPDPDLDMDEVGIPEDKAWDIYKPLLIRRLVRQGSPRVAAATLVATRAPAARKALLAEMDARPVMLDRAPVLWKYGVMAFKPKLVADDSMHISPMVVTGFGADFDGDAMQFHVPSTEAAAAELLEKLLPSRNLLSTGTFKVHQMPAKEYVGGLYAATANPDTATAEMVFDTPDDAIRAYQSGRIAINRRVRILNMK